MVFLLKQFHFAHFISAGRRQKEFNNAQFTRVADKLFYGSIKSQQLKIAAISDINPVIKAL